MDITRYRPCPDHESVLKAACISTTAWPTWFLKPAGPGQGSTDLTNARNDTFVVSSNVKPQLRSVGAEAAMAAFMRCTSGSYLH